MDILERDNIMKKILTILSITAFAIFSANSFAGGQEKNADKGKKHLQKHEQMKDMDSDQRREFIRQQDMQKHGADGPKRPEHQREHDAQRVDNQREKQIQQERNELGKGSEQGQKSREEHSRKWWKFGGADPAKESREEQRSQWWKFWGDDK
jgi:hypothetical protein